MDKIMRVAILDDAISIKTAVRYNTNKSENQEITHGDMVLATIRKYCNKAFFIYAFDIYKKNHPINEIIKALFFCLTHNINIVVMSFTINSKRYRLVIEELLCLLYKKNTIVLAADGKRCGEEHYPASSKFTIGVGSIERPRKYLQYLEDVRPEFIRVNNAYRLFNGSSKANAKMAGKIINNENSKIDVKQTGDHAKTERHFALEEGYYEDIFYQCLYILDLKKDIFFFEYYTDLSMIEEKILKILMNYQLEDACLRLNYSDMESVKCLALFIGNCLYEKNSICI